MMFYESFNTTSNTNTDSLWSNNTNEMLENNQIQPYAWNIQLSFGSYGFLWKTLGRDIETSKQGRCLKATLIQEFLLKHWNLFKSRKNLKCNVFCWALENFNLL